MFKSKKFWYISLFGLLYAIVGFSSFWHACAFFGLANNSWMSIILAFAFEIGQAAVLFSLLTSEKDRSRIMPWVLMTMFTLVQVIGNVFSSYKYIMNNSVEDLRYFKEPIFIWTSLPDEQATVIITYIVGAILPLCALFLTSMITNYLTDEEQKLKENKVIIELPTDEDEETTIVPEPSQKGPNPPIIINSPEELDKVYKEEYKNEEQTTEETKNMEEEPINTEHNNENDEIEKNIQDTNGISLNNPKPNTKPKEKSHFINL